MINVYYNNDKLTAILERVSTCEAWEQINYLFSGPEARISQDRIIIPWNQFLFKRRYFEYIVKQFPHSFRFDSSCTTIQKNSDENILLFDSPNEELSDDNINKQLLAKGFYRELFWYQVRNVKQLLRRNAGATFSVPGAGKTTEALAFFFYKKNINDKLLVISPINAFKAWNDDIKECLKDNNISFIEINSTRPDKVINILNGQHDLFLVNYDKVPRIVNELKNFLLENTVFLFLDESHYIKSESSSRGRATLDLSHLPKYKLILTGTPIPNRIDEIIPQMRFLFPEKDTTINSVLPDISSIYVRTIRKELEILQGDDTIRLIPFEKNLHILYKIIKERTIKTYELYRVSDLVNIRKYVILLLQLVSNPTLLIERLEKIRGLPDELLTNLESPKIDYAVDRARELANQGKKVVIWSTFVKNIEILRNRLSELNAVAIYGKIDSKERSGIIDKFNYSQDCSVIIINPAAGCEGISLHYNCHHAIYIDRSFNSVHWLQSKDRIRRIGQKEKPEFEILAHQNTIDDIINFRLDQKLLLMEKILDDKSIRSEIETVGYIDDEEEKYNYEDSIEDEIDYIVAKLIEENESE